MKNYWSKLLLCGVLTAASGVFAAPAGRPAETVKAGLVKSVPRELSRKYIGKITAVDDVSLIARVSGVIEKQKFNSGDIVKKGQELFVLEDTTYLAARNAARAKLAQCKAEYDYAKRNLARQQALWNKKATSESTYDEAVRQEAVSKAAVDAAEAALLDAENNLSYTRIISPLNGKAGKSALSEGNYVTPGTGELINIVALDKMYVNVWISMNDYLTIFDGSYETLKKEGNVRVFLADGREFTGKSSIVFIDNRVDKDTDTIRIRLLVENDGMHLLPDGLVTVRLSRRDGSKCAVPVSAVMNNGQISFVYVLDKENKAAIRPVELGEVQGNEQIILKGVQPGETIVFDGTHKVFPGSTVNPVIAAVEKK